MSGDSACPPHGVGSVWNPEGKGRREGNILFPSAYLAERHGLVAIGDKWIHYKVWERQSMLVSPQCTGNSPVYPVLMPCSLPICTSNYYVHVTITGIGALLSFLFWVCLLRSVGSQHYQASSSHSAKLTVSRSVLE